MDFYIGFYLELILLVLFAVPLSAQNELIKPANMDDITFTRFQDMIKYSDPDSAIFYRPGNDSKPYKKYSFKYNGQHQPVVEDEYQMNNQGYRLKQRIVKTYDPATAKLRQADLRILDKVYRDSISTRTEFMLLYDTAGNLALRYTIDTTGGASMRLTGDSIVYNYDKNGVPLSEIMYFFGYIGSDWIVDRIYKVEGLGSDGNPKLITVSVVNTEKEVNPIMQYKSITWARHCNSLEGIDTLANEFTVALFDDGKWKDSYKKVTAFNTAGKVDSTIVYKFKTGSLQPAKKDIYTYQGGLDFQSKLHYEYLHGNWQLTSGTRRTFSIGDNDNNHYYLELKEEVYEIPLGASEGIWKESYYINEY